VVRDWWRSIFPIRSGKHDRFPLDDSSPARERFALLEYWVQPGWDRRFLTDDLDPGNALGLWRRVKLLRGLLRHPDPRLRSAACEQLLLWGRAQDECFDQFDPASITGTGPGLNYNPIPIDEWLRNRRWENKFARQEWEGLLSEKNHPGIIDQLKMLTTVSNHQLREEFCRLFLREFPNDHDNGCPADQPPPATIVTVNGDVPLLGDWPADR
jgi:hypothetical protein